MAHRFVSTLAFGLSLICLDASAQSFSCGKASTRIERAICADAGLTLLDVQLADEFRLALTSAPTQADDLRREQREWLKKRDADCRAVENPNEFAGCLRTAYATRLSALTAVTKAFDPKAIACRTAVARMATKALASDRSPLDRLINDPSSGFSVVPELRSFSNGADDLQAWGQQQQPPVEIPEGFLRGLRDAYVRQFSLAQLPGTTLHAVHFTEGTAHCYRSRFFKINNGVMHVVAIPRGLGSEEDGGSCMVSRSFGSIDRTPAMFEDNFSGSPAMSSSLTIITWDGRQLADACKIDFEFEPALTAAHPDAANTCAVGECERLRSFAHTLTTSVQRDPVAARSEFSARLSPADRRKFEALSRSGALGSLSDMTNPTDLTEDVPLRVAFSDGERLYVASIGHRTIGWRYFADWQVSFQEIVNDTLIPRASFNVGMAKGAIKHTSVQAL